MGCNELAPVRPAKTKASADPQRTLPRIFETHGPGTPRAPLLPLDEGMHVVAGTPRRNRPSRSDATLDVMRKLVDVINAHVLIDRLYSCRMLIPQILLMLRSRHGDDEAAVVF
jgi:hypothetical protein